MLESLLGCGEYDLCQNVDVPAVSLVLDVGANVGYTVRHWAQQFPAARIVAVEPDSKNLAVCRENAKAARIEQRVEFVEAFVVGRHRPVSIDRTLGAWGYRIREEPSAEQTSVRTITMDELVDAYAKDGDTIFVKMDIEGAEREVFKSTGTWTERIVALVAEIHSPYDIDAALADLDRGGSHLSVADARHDGSYSLLALNRPKDRMPNL